MKILVTGCGRSGTQYTTRLLQALGLKATHEHVYAPDLDPNVPCREIIDQRWATTDCEVSWQAVPFIKRLPLGVVVWHQVRHPLKVVRCWLHTNILYNDDIRTLVGKTLPECGLGTPLERAVRYVHRWNRLAEKEAHNTRSLYYRYCIEGLEPFRLHTMLKVAGFHVNTEKIVEAMASVSTELGKCPCHDVEPTWPTVRQVLPDGEELFTMARRYGYHTG